LLNRHINGIEDEKVKKGARLERWCSHSALGQKTLELVLEIGLAAAEVGVELHVGNSAPFLCNDSKTCISMHGNVSVCTYRLFHVHICHVLASNLREFCERDADV